MKLLRAVYRILIRMLKIRIPADKFQRLTPRSGIIPGDPEELVHMEWVIDYSDAV